MRTREEIKADYFKDCGYEDGDFITTDEDYLLEEIFKVQNQAKNNEVLDLVMISDFIKYCNDWGCPNGDLCYEYSPLERHHKESRTTEQMLIEFKKLHSA